MTTKQNELWEKVEFGVCGLGNLGNSAYMNAPVQCLSNAQPLTEYILRDDFVSNINEKSKTGSGGIVTRVYADLLHEMWSGNTSCAHPHLLKEAMGKIFPGFANYKPNVAFDFSLLLLDTLHRDLNYAGQNYQPFPDDDNRADKVVAEEVWKIHLNRNKSIADQLFHLQLKRSLTCYDCKEVYKNFSVSMCVELPVPPIKLKEIIVMIKVVRADPTQPIIMVKVTIPEHGRISTLINKVSLQTGISSNKIMVINVCNYRFGKIFDVAEEFNYLTDRDNLYCYELPNTSTQNPDLIVIPVYNRVFCSERHTYDLNTCRQLFAVPQLVAVPRNNLTYKILYKLLLSHMSNYMKDSSPVKADIQNNSFGSNVREANKDETVVSKPVDYFTLNIVSKEGSIVLQELHDDDTSLKFDNNTYVACDWDPYWRKECFDVDKVEDYFNIKYTSDMEKISLLDCVKQWTAVEERILDFDLWHCPTCKKYRKCSSKFDIWTLPEVLVIRLKKWTVSDLKAKKLYTMVEFPIYGLDLSNYVINPDASKPVYNLFGVVNHYGGGTYGHYTAYAKNYLTGKWYHFDDSNVYEVDEDEVVYFEALYKIKMSTVSHQSLKTSSVIKTVDMHTSGMPVRIAVSGYPEIIGDTILDKLHYVKENLDHLRKLLILEPRGHKDMFGVIPVNSDIKEADMAVLFMHSGSDGYITMCGHATISTCRYAVDHGIVKGVSPETVVKIQCPCGLVTAHVEYQDGKVGAVRFESVPCFVFATDQKITLEGYGEICYDISYGGNFVVYTDTSQFGLDIKSSSSSDIAIAAMTLRRAVIANVTLTYPGSDAKASLLGVMFYSGPLNSSGDITEIMIFGNSAEVDRSPCGSGCSGLLSLLHHKELIKEGESRKFVNGKTLSSFNGKVVKQTKIKDTPAVIVEISGKGYYTGECTFYCEQDDPQPSFLVE
ncbi:ubiquitin carboxyl-terminal hydrolase 4-like isoform X3 [Dysidea avara]|uniref:ubiquitin carboxyl-terminal hydrolase 4-like isoform X3 n=1 Tax=Dysidea avara TaxID=196820 RepID=UPI003327E030